ncbi:MAG TPA: histidine phosphatase family protein [Candidatus Izemoplasmatales bacterium]|nr:histidine phosphatase family protein [Candidatus Izemoplasmatales bacterium]
MRIYLIRHGETDANKEMIIQGRANNPLNDTGIWQAKKTGEYLKKQDIDFDLCVTSPLSRSIDTANIIKETLGLELNNQIETEIIERDFGAFDGKQIDSSYYHMVHSGQVEGIETDQVIEERVKKFFIDFFKTNHHKNVLMVAHSHVIKALLVQYLPEFDYDTYLSNCCINIIDFDQTILIKNYNINPL